MNLTTTIFGIEMQSPIIVGSGPLSYGAEGMIRLHEAGAGAVVTKTIRDEPARNPYPHISETDKNFLINAEKWTDISGAEWIDREIPEAKKAGVVVVASIGHTPDEIEHWLVPADEAGADFFEIVSYRPETIKPMAELAKRLTDKPVVVKISPNWTDATATARELLEMGVDGITAMDSIGPVLSIDIESARPQVAGKRGFGWLSGAGIKPITMRYVAEIADSTDKPVIGLGGVMKADDAVEMLMAGASAVGVCTALILKGVDYIKTLNEGIVKRLEELGYASLQEVRGAALPNLYEEEVFRKFEFYYDKQLCIACNRCVVVCPYEARSLDLETKEMGLDTYRCRYCGLCTSVCPTDALTRSDV